MSSTQIVLTDVANNIWLEHFSLSETNGLILKGSADWSVSKRTLRGGRSEGVDVVTLDNGSLAIEVLPTRGMGIWRGHYRGIELGWRSPVRQPVHPGFVNLTERGGLGWLAGFNELICRCGLASNGAPGTDVVRDDHGNAIATDLTLHGKIANLPAHFVEVQVDIDGEGSLAVTGIVDETMMFGPCLRLQSTVRTAAGADQFTIVDTVTNLGGEPAELELLYHTNWGRPFLEPGAQFLAPIRKMAPRDTRAAEGVEAFQTYAAPAHGYREQVYYFDLGANEDGQSIVLLRNAEGDRGISLAFEHAQLPCFSLWKNTQTEADGYVTGLEPATNFPNLKTFERERGRVIPLAPNESRNSSIDVCVYDSVDEVAAVEQKIEAIQRRGEPTVYSEPQEEFSPI